MAHKPAHFYAAVCIFIAIFSANHGNSMHELKSAIECCVNLHKISGSVSVRVDVMQNVTATSHRLISVHFTIFH